jgi:hypothetical protein
MPEISFDAYNLMIWHSRNAAWFITASAVSAWYYELISFAISDADTSHASLLNYALWWVTLGFIRFL